ncbi:MAG: hypothetical protein IPL52_03985 [Flavobacteriales bacterium]|nr:hypothetical protein [Flavobacteriales bacterium]
MNISLLQHFFCRLVAIAALVLSSAATMAQVDVVVVFGTVKDFSTAKKLEGVTITVFKNGGKLLEVPTNASGKYEVNLDYGADYKIMCSRTNYVGKNISIDTRNIPEEDRAGGHGMNIDFTMMQDLPGVDFSVLQEPFGKAKYSPTAGNIEFDVDYTNKMRDAQARLLKEYEDKKKREANAEADFAKKMAEGNAALSANDFKKAVDSFTEALALKPNDALATAKLSDARMRLEAAEANKKQGEEYATLIKEGDQLFGKKDYNGARAKFQAASDVREQEPYPKQKLREIEALLAEAEKKAEEERKAKELQEKYMAVIALADAAFKAENWDQATAKYTEAAGIKPEERYPKDQLALVATKKAEAAKKAEDERKAKELQQKYDAAIAAGDQAFKASSWDIATTKYTEASGYKPDEQYPKDQLTAIAAKKDEAAKKAEEERLARELQQKYQAAIAAADLAFGGARYDDAEAKYNEALGYKPEEKYPKDQLAAIVKKREELAKKAEEERLAKDIDEQYKARLAEAMQAFSGDKWDEAIAKYTEASTLKPKEQYPKDQIALCNKKKEEQAKREEEARKQRELDERYQAAITAADASFGKEEWETASAKYTEASGVKPAERYPKDQLALIVQRKAEAEARKREEELTAQYKRVLEEADGAFGREEFTAAKSKYQEASNLKPQERYPKDRIAEVERLMAEKAKRAEEERLARERDAKYNELITRADKAFDAQKLSAALVDYQDASALKPDEAHPRARIAAIEDQLDAAAKAKAEEERAAREKAEKDKRYAELIAQADRDFTAKRYEPARTGYSDALGVKPDEQHPKDRLSQIEGILAELSKKEQADRLAREQADAERLRKEEADRLAAELAAAEKARLEEEERRKREEVATIETRYRDLVAAGDRAFGQDDFALARNKFTEALGVKPAERYPKDRIAAIDAELARRDKDRSEAERLAEQRRLQEEERLRREAEDAERRRLASDEERARLEAERLAKEQADAEARRAADERERMSRESAKEHEARYRQALVAADEALAAKQYQEARSMYAQASDLKPEDTYPLAKMDQIDRILAEQARLAQEAADAAERARLADNEQRRSNTTIDPRKEQEAEQFMREAREREEREKWERIRKLRDDLSAEEASNADEAASRRGQAVDDKERIENGAAGLYRGDETRRQLSAQQVQAQKDALARAEADRRERSAQHSAQQVEVKQVIEERVAAREEVMQERQVTASAAVVTEAERLRTAESQRVRQAEQRTSAERDAVVARIDEQAQRQQRADEANAQRAQAVEEEKRAMAARDAAFAQSSELVRERNKQQLDATPRGQQRTFAEYNRSKLAEEYPPGVTEESYTEGNKVIIRRVVVNGNKADEYSKVIAKWGTYYFKNGQSITEAIWAKETEG